MVADVVSAVSNNNGNRGVVNVFFPVMIIMTVCSVGDIIYVTNGGINETNFLNLAHWNFESKLFFD